LIIAVHITVGIAQSGWHCIVYGLCIACVTLAGRTIKLAVGLHLPLPESQRVVLRRCRNNRTSTSTSSRGGSKAAMRAVEQELFSPSVGALIAKGFSSEAMRTFLPVARWRAAGGDNQAGLQLRTLHRAILVGRPVM